MGMAVLVVPLTLRGFIGGLTMFYETISGVLYPTRCCRYIINHLHYYEEWNKVRFIRRVSYDNVVWC